MDNLKDVIYDIKEFIVAGFSRLPLCIASVSIILGLFTANYALLFFLAGFLILAPLSATLINLLASWISKTNNSTLFTLKLQDSCQVSFPSKTLNNAQVPPSTYVISEWLAMIMFFLGYIGTNAYELYTEPPISNEKPKNDAEQKQYSQKMYNRKSQALLSIVILILLSLGILYYRLTSNCEPLSTIFLESTPFSGQLIIGSVSISAIIIFLLMGTGWYKILSSTLEGRLSDLFGIVNRMMPPSAFRQGPVACVPIDSQ